MKYAHQQTYAIEFSDSDWDELWCLTFEPFEFEAGEALTRGQWFALAEMALGKAQLIDEGQYDMGANDDGYDPEEWSDQLRTIARRILNEFQPGDGKL